MGGRRPVRLHHRRPAGRPVKIVSIVDEHTRECIDGPVEHSITADRLIAEVDRLADQRGYPAVLAATTDPNWPAQRWPTAPASASGSRSSHPANPGTTATSNPSTAGSATNASTSIFLWSLAPAGVVINDWESESDHHRHTQPSATKPTPEALRSAPTNESRLAQRPDHFQSPVAATADWSIRSVRPGQQEIPTCSPDGIRTRATALRGRRARPLHNGALANRSETGRGRLPTPLGTSEPTALRWGTRTRT